ncbi:hypothetical protein SCHPADRAFT_906433 [Schizopora paradoxa]|uniref:Uncharacterized protein n=1 Tax=Schizopora paradoxa TaxID=27342 RepID=A0A0H2RGM5_9AGAM|nr:hypothetical protein SCHPADRAFT_906433 [Schizopora paradoxa]
MSSGTTVPLKEQMFAMGGEDKYIVVSESKVLNEWEDQISHLLKAKGMHGTTNKCPQHKACQPTTSGLDVINDPHRTRVIIGSSVPATEISLVVNKVLELGVPKIWVQPESAGGHLQALVDQDDRVVVAQNADDLVQVFSLSSPSNTPMASL